MDKYIKFLLATTITLATIGIAIHIVESLINIQTHSQGLDRFGDQLKYEKKEWNDGERNSIIRIDFNDGSTCTGFVISDKLAVSAAHCFLNKYRIVAQKEFMVRDDKLEVAIPARLMTISYGPDIAVITGDFSEFNAANIITDGSVVETQVLIHCGFPYGRNKVECFAGQSKGPYIFQRMSTASLFSGQSGGPTIDAMTGGVVGVNSAMGNVAYYETLMVLPRLIDGLE